MPKTLIVEKLTEKEIRTAKNPLKIKTLKKLPKHAKYQKEIKSGTKIRMYKKKKNYQKSDQKLTKIATQKMSQIKIRNP